MIEPTPKDSNVTLSVREYNQLLATLMEAGGWFDLQRKSGRMWPSAPEGVLAAAQRLLAEKVWTTPKDASGPKPPLPQRQLPPEYLT